MRERYDTNEDKNFDDLAPRFKNSIYGGLKGQVRLAVLERDLAPYLAGSKRVFDIGGGQGHFALSLASKGHKVTLCDISEEMLKLAKHEAALRSVDTIDFIHCSLQELHNHVGDEQADLVMCHAVLEWLAKPESGLDFVAQNLQEGGIMSLAFFNRDAIMYKNLLRGNYYKVRSENYVGTKGSLTPLHPLTIEEVLEWCDAAGFDVINYSGIRVFHDYIGDPLARARAHSEVLSLELELSQKDPFRALGRYIHVVAKKR